MRTLTFYYSTVMLLKLTLVTNSNYLNLVCNENLNFPDYSYLFLRISMMMFLFLQVNGFKSKMGALTNFFEILLIFCFRCKFFISRLILMVEIKRIKVNWYLRLDGLQ